MAPIVLSMDVHCKGCAKDIRKALKKFGWVESVSASYETGLVNEEVEGVPASYEMAVVLQLRLSRKMRNKPVTIVSYGGLDDEEQPPSRPAPAVRARTSPPNYPPPPPPTRRYTPSSPPNYPPPSPPTSRSSSSYYTPTYSPPPTSSSSDYPPGGFYSYYAPPPRQPDGGYSYPPLDDYYNYDQSRGGPYYVPNFAPTTFNDENPNACSIQ